MNSNSIKAYKGFNADMSCRGFRYEVGKEYDHPGPVRVCESGFHACENPMDVLGYYSPFNENGNLTRYCEVELSGEIDKSGADKTCSSHIRILAEIGLDGLIKAGVKFILDKVNWKDKKKSNTGDCSAATNTGDRSAATNTGYRSAATNTGYRSAATNTGDCSAAAVEGKESIAIVTGYDSRAKGTMGCWLVITERDSNGHILDVKAAKVDGVAVKPDTWYRLRDGEFVECME